MKGSLGMMMMLPKFFKRVVVLGIVIEVYSGLVGSTD